MFGSLLCLGGSEHGVTGGRRTRSSSPAARKTSQIAITRLLVSRDEAELDPQLSRKSSPLQADPGPPNPHPATIAPPRPDLGSLSPTCPPDSRVAELCLHQQLRNFLLLFPPPKKNTPTLASTTPREASLVESIKIGKKKNKTPLCTEIRGPSGGLPPVLVS